MATDPTAPIPANFRSSRSAQTVVFPLTLQPLAVNRPVSIEAVNRALAGDRLVFLALQNNDSDDPEPDDLQADRHRSPPSARWPRRRTAASTSSSKA